MWWMLGWAQAAPVDDWSDLVTELASALPGMESSVLAGALDGAESDDESRLRVAAEVATRIADAEPSYTRAERQVLFEVVLAGSEAQRTQAVSMVGDGKVSGAMLLEDLHHELALMEPIPRLKALKAWRESRLDSPSIEKVGAAYAVAYPLRGLEVSAAEVSDQLAVALGNDPEAAFALDPVQALDALAGLDSEAEIDFLDGLWELVEGDDRVRVATARTVSRKLGVAKVDPAAREMMLRFALSADPETRAQALKSAETAGGGASDKPVGPVVSQRTKLDAIKAYKAGRLRIHNDFIEVRDFSRTTDVAAGNTVSSYETKLVRTWDVNRGRDRLNAFEWGELVDPAMRSRARKNQETWKTIMYAGVPVLAVGVVGSAMAVKGFNDESTGLAVGGATLAAAGFVTGPSMILGGALIQKDDRHWAAHYYNAKTGRSEAQDLADQYNSELASKLGLSEMDVVGFDD